MHIRQTFIWLLLLLAYSSIHAQIPKEAINPKRNRIRDLHVRYGRRACRLVGGRRGQSIHRKRETDSGTSVFPAYGLFDESRSNLRR